MQGSAPGGQSGRMGKPRTRISGADEAAQRAENADAPKIPHLLRRISELFAPHIHQQRIDTWPQLYPWVEPEGLQYFRNRLTQARRDVEHGLRFTLDYFSRTRALQERALEILQFKLDVLWALADAIMLSQCEIEIRGAKA